MIRTRQTDSGIRYDVMVGRKGAMRTFTRKGDAEEYEAELIRARRRGRAGLEAAKPGITWAELIQLWIANYAPSDWRLFMVSYSYGRWNTAYVREIQPEQLGAWIASLKGKSGKPLAEKTRAHILETMRRVLNAGVEWGYLDRSPARPGAFKTPSKNAREKPIQPFESWDEVLRVADACAALNPIAGPFVRFACATGLRCPGEILHLRWENIDLQNLRAIRVSSKTAAGHRTVPLSRHASAALSDLPRSLSGYIFPGKRGSAFDYANWRNTDWRLALDTCGMPHRTPYEMRHTFATLALAHGASIDDVATVMGHDDITVAYRFYRKWIKTMADRLVVTLDQIGTSDETHARADHRRNSSR